MKWNENKYTISYFTPGLNKHLVIYFLWENIVSKFLSTNRQNHLDIANGDVKIAA